MEPVVAIHHQILMPFVVKLQVHLAHAFAEGSAAVKMVQIYNLHIITWVLDIAHLTLNSK